MAWTVWFLVLLYLLDLIAAQQTMLITELQAYSKLDNCQMSAVSSVAVLFTVVYCSGVNVATSLASCICLEYAYSVGVSAEIQME